MDVLTLHLSWLLNEQIKFAIVSKASLLLSLFQNKVLNFIVFSQTLGHVPISNRIAMNAK